MPRNLKNLINIVNKATKEMPVEKLFLQDVKRSIELTEIKNRVAGSKSYKPSAMKCIRQMAYIVLGKPEDDMGANYMGIGICNVGTDIHQRIQRAVLDMRNNGFDCEYVNVADYVRSRELHNLEVVKEPDFEHGEYETKLFDTSLNMSFLCDGIVRYMGKYYILEIKSEGSKKFYSREAVNPEHYNQGTAYSMELHIDDVLFVYISRDTLDIKAYMFTPTGDMKQALAGLIANCDSYVKRLKVPPKPVDVSKYTCEYCSYKQQCRKDG